MRSRNSGFEQRTSGFKLIFNCTSAKRIWTEAAPPIKSARGGTMYQHQDRTGKQEEPIPGFLGKPLLDTLERMGYGGILFDRHGNALHANASAIRILRKETDDPPGPP